MAPTEPSCSGASERDSLPALSACPGGQRLEVRASRGILLLTLALHLIVASALAGSSLPKSVGLALAAMLMASLLVSWRKLAAAQHLEILLGSSLDVRQGSGADTCEVVEVSDFGWALWLGWRTPDGRIEHRMLMRDSLDRPSAWPLLRTWARYRRAQNPYSGDR